MLNRHLISDDEALWQIEMMAWLINQYGPPLSPPVPSPLQSNIPLSRRSWMDTDSRMSLKWAEDEYHLIWKHLKLGHIDIALIPNADNPDTDQNYGTETFFTGGWQKNLHSRVRLDISGRPVICYDPRRCDVPGYFTARVLMDVAKLYISHAPPREDFDPCLEPQLILMGAAHLGQAFTLTTLDDSLIKEIVVGQDMTGSQLKSYKDMMTFSAVLTLTCRQFSPEQIIATYGPLLCKRVRKNIWNARRAIDRFPQELKMLQILCGHKNCYLDDSPITASKAVRRNTV